MGKSFLSLICFRILLRKYVLIATFGCLRCLNLSFRFIKRSVSSLDQTEALVTGPVFLRLMPCALLRFLTSGIYVIRVSLCALKDSSQEPQHPYLQVTQYIWLMTNTTPMKFLKSFLTDCAPPSYDIMTDCCCSLCFRNWLPWKNQMSFPPPVTFYLLRGRSTTCTKSFCENTWVLIIGPPV